jgi:adenine nucleotide transporter 17
MSNLGMIRKIFREEGIGGFFKGIVPSLILTLNPVIQFTTYDLMKMFLQKRNGKLSPIDILAISLGSKFITILTNYPLITLKTLYMANSKKSSSEMWQLICSMYRQEGLLGFFKGISNKVLGSTINNMILMMTYEKIQIFVRLFLARILLRKAIISFG